LAPQAKTRLAIALLAACLAVAPALAGCGDDGEAKAQPEKQSASALNDARPEIQRGGVIDISGTDAVGENLAGSVASLVECRDWNEATPEQKLATIDDVRSQVSREGGAVSSPALTDAEALAIFDSACEPGYAQGFRLYKLYSHAAGFAPLAREVGQP